MKTLISLSVLLTLSLAAADTPKKKFDPAEDINKPRADARKVNFSVSEGTWMSVDVSPDGSTIVFDLLGDIYSMPAAGGKATAITRGPAFDWHPRYSPDGKTIAFTSDRSGIDNIWIMGPDGKNPRSVTTEKDEYVRSAMWSPDGNYLVARKETGKRGGIPPVELWMYHLRGGSGLKLTSGDEMNNGSGPAFSADGRFIYFSGRSARFSYVPNLTRGLWQIYRYDRETGDTVQLTSGYGGAVRPQITADGKSMIFVSRRDNGSVLVVRDLAAGSERIVARDVTRDEQEGFAQADLWPAYAVSRDGRWVTFSNNGKIVRLDLQSGRDAAGRVHGGRRAVLHAACGVAGPRRAGSGARSHPSLAEPDAGWIGGRVRRVREDLDAEARRRQSVGRAAAPHERHAARVLAVRVAGRPVGCVRHME